MKLAYLKRLFFRVHYRNSPRKFDESSEGDILVPRFMKWKGDTAKLPIWPHILEETKGDLKNHVKPAPKIISAINTKKNVYNLS